MTAHRLTDTEIAIRIVPKRLRWPQAGTTITWTKAHACVNALQDLIRKVDQACIEAEQNRELSAGASAVAALRFAIKPFESWRPSQHLRSRRNL